MCCITPPITVRRPSAIASTSPSNASSRKRSISTGCSGATRAARRFQRLGETQWGLAAQLHDHALGTLQAHNLQYVLERQRLEVQLVRDVEVRRHRFRVRVDHDGLEAQLTKRQAGPDTAIVE